MSLEDYEDNLLWPILVDTVHKMILYPHYKSYVRDVILRDRPDISPQDLSSILGISMGEALVMLYELRSEKDSAK